MGTAVLACAILGCAQTPRTVIIVAFGDSTTAPRRVEGSPLPVYAGVLQTELLNRGMNAAVINAGVSGNTTADARERLEKDVLTLAPDVAIIQFGLNDSAINVHMGATGPRLPRDEYEENLTFVVETLRERGTRVILMTPNPMLWTQNLISIFGKPPYEVSDRWGLNLLNAEYAESVRRIARKQRVRLIDVYQHYLDYDSIEGRAAEDLLLDGIHPNEKGHRMVADILAIVIAGMKLPSQPPRGFSIPLIDLAQETHRQVIVDRQEGQYLGHPTTVLLEDNMTMICVYPKGHGRGAIVMKRSTDAGLTWGERLPVPDNWSTSQEVPTIHRVIDPQGVKRLIMFSGLYPIRMAVSEDDGQHWTPLAPIGDFGGIVAMGCVERLRNGDYMAMFHDDGRFIQGGGRRRTEIPVFHVYKTISRDGGLTWNRPVVVADHPVGHLCEPGLVRSPDGSQIAVLLRENSRRLNSFVIFSDDEGRTWSEPRELPGALTGDRHTGRYAPDGRLFISFRDRTHDSPTWGDWVGWVGTYEDIEKGREGQYRVRLMDNHRSADCAYPAVEVLIDGTFVTTTYGHWTPDEEPFIVSVRFRLAELDAKAAEMSQ